MASKKRTAEEQKDMTMKIVLAVSLLVVFVAGYFIARAKYKPQIIELSKMVADKDQSLQKFKSNANKVMMKEDKMWIVENGELKQMDSDLMMTNGEKVTSEGEVIKTDGSSIMMQNGDAMDMNGKMLPKEQ